MHQLSLQATVMSRLKKWFGFCAQVICEPFFFCQLGYFSLWGIFKQKQLLHCLFLPLYSLGTFWMWIYAWCIHAVLRDTIYFDKRQYFPWPRVHITPQMSHLSMHPSGQFSVTLLQDMIIKASLIVITNTHVQFYPPTVKCLLMGMKWKWWLILVFKHQSGPSEAWRLRNLWSADPFPLTCGFATSGG